MNGEVSKACPFWTKSKADEELFLGKVEEARVQIEEDMKALGLKPETMKSLVRTAALLSVRNERYALLSAITPLTYDEKSREGNVKPVTHPIHIQANSTSGTLANALKQLGIYAATDKVSTKVAEAAPVAVSAMEELYRAMSE